MSNEWKVIGRIASQTMDEDNGRASLFACDINVKFACGSLDECVVSRIATFGISSSRARLTTLTPHSPSRS